MWRHHSEDHWYLKRSIIRALRRDPIAHRSNGTRGTVEWIADRLERGELKIVEVPDDRR
jgi:hypothetical protein